MIIIIIIGLKNLEIITGKHSVDSLHKAVLLGISHVRLGCRWREGLQIWRVAANILNKQSRIADKEWS
jgi:hypothetical protein